MNDEATRRTELQHAAPAAPQPAAKVQPKDVSAVLDAETFDKLERDMQTLPPDEVKLPASLGGGTLADLQARREAAHTAEGIAASKEREEALAGDTSATLPSEHKVTITADGQLISSPVTVERADPEAETVAPQK
jgi:hypothetical protein